MAPKTAQVDAVAPSPVLPAVVHSAYAVTAYTMPTGVVPPALSAAPLSAAPTTMPSAPVSLAPLALVLAAAYPQSSASSVTATAPAATVTTSAPPSAGTPTVVATIPVDPWAIAITKDGKTIYGTSSPYATDANGTPVATVQVVDASTNTQVGEPIPVGQFVAPGNIVTNPTMNRAYVVAYNPATITNPSTGYSQTGYLPSLVVIDTSTNKTIGSPIPLVTSDQNSTTMTSPGPSALAVSPDGSRVYVAGATVTSSYTGQVTSWRPTVTVFDTTTNTQVGDTLGIGPVSTNLYSGTGATSVLVSPDGKRLYVTTASNLTSSSSSSPSVTTTIYTVDSKSGAPVGNPIILTNDAGALIPQTEALSPDGTKLYVESLSYPAITIGAQNTQPQSAQEIANATVLTFNTSTGQQVGTPINVVGYGVMTLSPDGKTLYVSDVADSRTGKKASYQPYAGLPTQTMYDGSVTGYDLSTGKGIGAPTTVGLGPTSMVVNPAGTRLYVANMADNTISVIDLADGSSGGLTPIATVFQTAGAALHAAVVQLQTFVTAAQKSVVAAVQKTAAVVQQTVSHVQQQVVAQVQQIVNTVKSAVNSIVTFVASAIHQSSPSAQQFNPTAQALYTRLRDTADTKSGIWVDKIVNSNNKISYIVYLGGTQLDPGAQQNLGSNIPSALHQVKSAELQTIVNAIYAKGGDPHAPIMLVGFSQGGIDAQNIAESATGLNIKSVVMYAAPLVYWSPNSRFTQIDLVATGDPVPGLTPLQQTQQQLHGHVYGPAIPSDYWRYTAAEAAVVGIPYVGAGLAGKIALDYHGDRETYSSVAKMFDQDKGYRDVKASIANFSGKVFRP
ncbi:hypothetical protein [Mycolicibacterium sp. lyk4-40-TYG-92]|uniref:hypothetical protein n=1 Tax=Mycolicibacterium sp. lyk4-40-TYG-92 TaxID=3040295 RepID=UPI00254AC3AE|nr:hypothetical protein [Mycolicibacterium sp. lyk4-40-TYG-92]